MRCLTSMRRIYSDSRRAGHNFMHMARYSRTTIPLPTLQKALAEDDGVSIVDVTVDCSRSVDLAATLVERPSYEHSPGSARSSVRRSGQ
jgi:hypothetical protein